MDNAELVCLQIITDVGNARSKYIEAIQEAKIGNYEGCNELLRQGNESYQRGYRKHAELVGKEAEGQKADLSLLLIHAEDQLMSAESFKLLCNEFVDVYRKFDNFQEQTTK